MPGSGVPNSAKPGDCAGKEKGFEKKRLRIVEIRSTVVWRRTLL
jgi:hypothetical protein